ncbi:MAG: DUF4835 family protein [Saprospiraceae bacterium]|nr:DUF4835 family protein [Saprospiraceae bacterium]
MKRFILLYCLFAGLSTSISAQEMIATVSVNTPNLSLTDPKVFQTLEASIVQFMNNQVWTNDTYEPEERIKVSITMTISEEYSANVFKADLAIQAVRPVYGSTYESALITHIDRDVTFTYEQFQPLEFAQNGFKDNLSQVLSFYAYIILGLDGDSFSPFGGQPYFQIAQDVLNNVPSSVQAGNPGWRSIDGNRNRYWVIENILSPRVRPYRQAMYDYHRQALDLMATDVESGRKIMLQALEELNGVNQVYPNAMIIQMFTNAKGGEVVEIFKLGTVQEKNRVVQIMSKLDPSNAQKYREIRS